MQFILITNNTSNASIAESCGVDRVMVDLETIGKDKRQGGLDTVISRHSMADVTTVRSSLRNTALQVRVNPIHASSETEIGEVIERGADRVMLPMFSAASQVSEFLDYVDGRASTTLLLETPQALVRIEEILSLEGIDEVHIGLNDLHLGLGLDFMFELIVGPFLESVCCRIRDNGIRLGIGGVASLGHGKVPAELILSRLAELGARTTILSRSFAVETKDESDDMCAQTFDREYRRIREYCKSLESNMSSTSSEELRLAVKSVASALASRA